MRIVRRASMTLGAGILAAACATGGSSNANGLHPSSDSSDGGLPAIDAGALRFTVSHSQQGYIHPATHAAGASDASLPPMGLRVRLKATFDVSKFAGAAAVILTAMQQYGLILADNGSDWYVSGDSDDAWAPLMDGVTQAFSQVHGSDFEVVQTGPIQ